MKTLIAYVTKTGTAKKAAQMIAEKLKDTPDVVDFNETKTMDLSGYDFILVGGSVSMGKVNKAVKKFLAKNKKALLATRFGFFLACGYPKDLQTYIDATLDADLKAHAEVKTDIGYAFYLENMGPIGKRVVMQMAKTEKSIEAYKPEAIQTIADVINK